MFDFVDAQEGFLGLLDAGEGDSAAGRSGESAVVDGHLEGELKQGVGAANGGGGVIGVGHRFDDRPIRPVRRYFQDPVATIDDQRDIFLELWHPSNVQERETSNPASSPRVIPSRAASSNSWSARW